MEMIQQDSNRALFKPGPEFTIYQVNDYLKALRSLEDRIRTLEADLSETGELDTAGVQFLLALQRECARKGRDFRISAMSQAVRETLDLLRLTSALTGTV